MNELSAGSGAPTGTPGAERSTGRDRSPFLAAGKWRIGSGAGIRSINPATGEINAELSTPTGAELDEAVLGADAAWRAAPPRRQLRPPAGPRPPPMAQAPP